jgi:cell division protease FtsH
MWAQLASSPQSQRISYSEFKGLLYDDKIDSVLISETSIRGMVRADALEPGIPRVFSATKVADPELVKELESRGVKFGGHYPSPVLGMVLGWVVPLFLLGGLWYLFSRRMQAGGGLMAMGKSKAKLYVEHETGVTFGEVAGR